MLTLPTLVLTLSAIAAAAGSAGAQTDGTCIPEAERAGRTLGCFITASTPAPDWTPRGLCR